MHKYKIRYIDIHNVEVTTIVYAISETQATAKLTGAIEIISIKDTGKLMRAPAIIRKVFHLDKISFKELADILRNISYTRQAGLTIVDSLTVLSSTGSVRQILLCDRLLLSLQEGASLAEAFAKESDYLPMDISGIIAASAKADTLNEVLISLADQLESNMNAASKLKTAMLYPGFILMIAIAVAWFLFTIIIPQVASVIQDIGTTDLPDTTLLVLGISEFLQANGWYILFAIIGVVVLASIFFSKILRQLKDRLVLRIPIIGGILRDSELMRFVSHMGFLLSAGFTSLDAVNAATLVTGNKYVRQQLQKGSSALLEGYSISDSLALSHLFTAIELQMISIGEKSGSLVAVCSTITRQLADQSERHLQNMIKLIEPIIMVTVGLIVGFIMLSIYQPLFEMMSLV